MRGYLLILVFFMASSFAVGVVQDSIRSIIVPHDSFETGEYLTYKASYGFFHVGEVWES